MNLEFDEVYPIEEAQRRELRLANDNFSYHAVSFQIHGLNENEESVLTLLDNSTPVNRNAIFDVESLPTRSLTTYKHHIEPLSRSHGSSRLKSTDLISVRLSIHDDTAAGFCSLNPQTFAPDLTDHAPVLHRSIIPEAGETKNPKAVNQVYDLTSKSSVFCSSIGTKRSRLAIEETPCWNSVEWYFWRNCIRAFPIYRVAVIAKDLQSSKPVSISGRIDVWRNRKIVGDSTRLFTTAI